MNIHRLKTHFDDIKGIYVSASLDHMHKALAKLKLKGKFLDAGSGDGRIVALAALYGLDSIGIEQDDALYKTSKKVLGMRLAGCVKLLKGDFSKDETYAKAGIKFDDISTIFNFYDNHWLIADKIAQESKPGTQFLLLSPTLPRMFAGLELKDTITFNGFPNYFLQVYKKV